MNDREKLALTLKEHFELLGYDVEFYEINDDYNLYITDETCRFERRVEFSAVSLDYGGMFVLVQCKGEPDYELNGPVSTSDLESLTQHIEYLLM